MLKLILKRSKIVMKNSLQQDLWLMLNEAVVLPISETGGNASCSRNVCPWPERVNSISSKGDWAFFLLCTKYTKKYAQKLEQRISKLRNVQLTKHVPVG